MPPSSWQLRKRRNPEPVNALFVRLTASSLGRYDASELIKERPQHSSSKLSR